MRKLSMGHACLSVFTLAASALAVVSPLHAAMPAAETDLTELSLQELTNVKVTTFAKRPQRAADVAAALFVITQDDIRRVGATSIPEALRLAPGLQVARIDGNKWSISARGFSGRFANKLLVLMDGRALYTPTFAGVYWDVQDTLIDDIERIEVIRGPAGTTWGTNAVNGIINIITKRADQTDGLLIGSEAGVDGSTALNVRFGDADDADTQWRMYAKTFERAANESLNGATAFDDVDQQRIGARVDRELAAGQNLRLSVEGYQGHTGHTLTGSFFNPLQAESGRAIEGTESVDGIWGAAEWTRQLSADSQLGLQMYVDHSNRIGPGFSECRDTADIDFQQSLTVWRSHTITWGLGLRYNLSEMGAFEGVVVDDDSARFFLGSAYLQDEINLLEDLVTITAGARIEDSSRDELELLPNLRARVALTDTSMLWGAIAKGARRPGRIEEDVQASSLGSPVPPNSPLNPLPVPVTRSMVGMNSFDSEQLISYESGWRWQAHDDVSLDLALFYNDYDRLRALELLPAQCLPSGELLAKNPLCVLTAQQVLQPATAGNGISGHTKGGELALGWTPLTYWRLTGTYSHLKSSLRGVLPDPASVLFVVGQDPEQQYSLRSSISIGPRWDWDVFAKHRSEITSVALPSATQLDARIAWRPTLDLEVALLGRNLLEHAQVEATSELFDLTRIAIERDILLQVRWSLR